MGLSSDKLQPPRLRDTMSLLEEKGGDLNGTNGSVKLENEAGFASRGRGQCLTGTGNVKGQRKLSGRGDCVCGWGVAFLLKWSPHY